MVCTRCCGCLPDGHGGGEYDRKGLDSKVTKSFSRYFWPKKQKSDLGEPKTLSVFLDRVSVSYYNEKVLKNSVLWRGNVSFFAKQKVSKRGQGGFVTPLADGFNKWIFNPSFTENFTSQKYTRLTCVLKVARLFKTFRNKH